MDIFKSIKIAQPLIKEKEGFFTDLKNGYVAAYRDPIGIPTIGWGTTEYSNGKKVKMGDKITYAQAQSELDFHMLQKANQLLPHITFPINDSQMAAFISFSYNAGVGKLGKLGDSGIVNKSFFRTFANTGDSAKASKLMETSTVTAGGVVLRGLILRRKKEAALLAVTGDEKKSLVQTVRQYQNPLLLALVIFLIILVSFSLANKK